MIRLLAVVVAMLPVFALHAAERPFMSPPYGSESVDGFIDTCEYPMSLSEEEMLDLVPQKNGMALIGCPNCPPGRPEGRFDWDPHQPNQIVCQRCGHVYPSDEYPADKIDEVTTPAGNTVEYRYWERDDGYRYYFGARIAKEKQQYMVGVALKMAHIYHYTGKQEYARRAALIINCFAEVYPDYIYKYEMPYRQKILYDGDVDPRQERGWRTSRWEWWGYKDIPDRLITAYDLIADSGEFEKIEGSRDRIINDFFIVAADTVMSQEDTFHNMSPAAYTDMVITSRVLQKPKYIHEVVERVQKMCTRRFFYDGSWYEGAPSYHRQVMNLLDRVFDKARGYSDPEGYTHPETKRRFDDLHIAEYVPEVKRAEQALADMRMPNGRMAPLHDTWSTTRSEAIEESKPILFGGLGHAKLGRGEGSNQMQLHLTWSAGYGHRHYDGLSMLLFAKGKELLSDLGYTHTRYDGYKRSTVCHNTVVVDMSIQHAMGEPTAEGKLLFWDAQDPDMQVVSVDNSTCYPKKVERYERTMALVGIDESDGYVVDCFTVKSPHQQDYFIHGSADEPQAVQLFRDGNELDMEPVETMVPEELEWEPPVAEDRQSLIRKRGWSYGLLWDNAVTRPEGGVCRAQFTYAEGGPVTNVFFVAEQGDEVYTGTDPQIRLAKEDDALIDEFKRPHFMIRRAGAEEANVFLSVIEPAEGDGHIRSVSIMETTGDGIALEIEADAFTDIVTLYADRLAGTYNGTDLSAEGLIGRMRIRDGEVVRAYTSERIQFGPVSITSDLPKKSRSARLLSVDRFDGQGAFVVDADWREHSPPPGTFIILDHGDGYTHAYEVESVESIPEGTRIVLADEPGFEYDPATQTADFLFHPRYSHTGPHRVLWKPGVSMKRKAGE